MLGCSLQGIHHRDAPEGVGPYVEDEGVPVGRDHRVGPASQALAAEPGPGPRGRLGHGQVGLGGATPQQTLSLNGGLNVDQASQNVGNVNNALTTVLGNAELLAHEPGLPATVRSQADALRNMALRLHEIFQRFSSLEKELTVAARDGKSKSAAAGS